MTMNDFEWKLSSSLTGYADGEFAPGAISGTVGSYIGHDVVTQGEQSSRLLWRQFISLFWLNFKKLIKKMIKKNKN
jgi:hypothetical protein